MSLLPHPRVLIVPAALVVVLLAVIGHRGWSLSRAQSLDVYGAAPAFALTDQLERPASADELRGKVVVADFIYTNCPDICPLLSLRMKELQERLRGDSLLGSQVQLLSFTVDPARDTPSVLQQYAERFEADPGAWRFLTGPEEALVPLIVEGFHLGVQALPPQPASRSGGKDHDGHPEQYEVMHSGRFVLIDRRGHIRAWYDGREFDLERVVRDIHLLLR